MRIHKYTTDDEIEYLKQEIKTQKQHHSSNIQIFKIIRYSLFLFFFFVLSGILLSILISKNSGETPQIFGYQFYRVMSGSMSPTLKIGSVILSKTPEDNSALKVGDIITFEENGAVITHRIIEVVKKDGTKYRTKGDNPENSPDIWFVSPDSVKAVFVRKIY